MCHDLTIRGDQQMDAEHPNCDARQVFSGFISVTPLAASFETHSAGELNTHIAQWRVFGGKTSTAGEE